MGQRSGGPGTRRSDLGDAAALNAMIRQGLAGALGGFLVFLLLEPMESSVERLRQADVSQGAFWLGIAFGALVPTLLVIADEAASGRALRVLARALLALLLGTVIGLFASIAANVVFAVLLFAAALGGGVLFQILARTVGWAVFGAGVGLCGGLVSRSRRRVQQGSWGGMLGGAAGGILFDLLAAFTGSGTMSRLVGFVVVAACVGLFTAVAEQLARTAWVSFLTGTREGRQVLLHRDSVILGRDELVDLPLFGDATVERKHAEISLTPAPRIHEFAAQSILLVDGQPVRDAALYDGAVIQLGRHRLRFHHRNYPAELVPGRLSGSGPSIASAGPGASTAASSPWASVESAPNPWADSPRAVAGPGDVDIALHPPGYNPALSDLSPDATIAMVNPGALQLRFVSGPQSGRVVRLESAPLTLGRDASAGLQVVDGKVSRSHARIEPVEGAWLLTDLDSTNGTRVNGLRIRRAGLAPGDQIGLGDVLIQVEASS